MKTFSKLLFAHPDWYQSSTALLMHFMSSLYARLRFVYVRKTFNPASRAISVSIFCPSPKPCFSSTWIINPLVSLLSCWWKRNAKRQQLSLQGRPLLESKFWVSVKPQVCDVPRHGCSMFVNLGSQDFLHHAFGL